MHWKTVQLTCHRTLVKGFQKLGIFKSPESPNSGSWNSWEAILASGESSTFFPHGVGHSLGLDIHDVPDASKPKINNTIWKEEMGHESFYAYLRLMLPLRVGMVVVRLNPKSLIQAHLLEFFSRPLNQGFISLLICLLPSGIPSILIMMY